MAGERTVVARSVAAPVFEAIERSGGVGKVLGAGSRTAFVSAGDFVIAITRDRLPLLPNGVTVTVPLTGMLGHGDRAHLSSSRIETTGYVIELAGARRWDPTVIAAGDRTRDDVRRRGVSLLEACEISAEPVPAALAHAIGNRFRAKESRLHGGIEGLLDALVRRDPSLASAAARTLAGKGPGLTPEGDDLLAAAAGAVVAFGPAVGFDGPEQRMWLDALGAERTRTTGLAGTLMSLARRGMVMEPAGRVMNLRNGDGWLRGLRRLKATGHSTGRAYALAIGASGAVLGSPVEVH